MEQVRGAGAAAARRATDNVMVASPRTLPEMTFYFMVHEGLSLIGKSIAQLRTENPNINFEIVRGSELELDPGVEFKMEGSVDDVQSFLRKQYPS